MKARHPLHEFMPYGAPDLLVARRPDLSRALGVSSFFVAAAFVLAAVLASLAPVARQPDVAVPSFDLTRVLDLTPPRLVPPSGPPLARVRPAPPPNAPPRIASDESKSPPDIPNEYREYAKGLQGHESSRPGTPTITGDPPIEPPGIVDPDLPVATVDEWPVAVKEVKPEYPEIARDALVDGKVVVLVLVGRDGRVRDAKLDPGHHVPMLDQVALEAAKLWVFSPGLVNGRPVSVWTAIPFDFVLQ